MRLSLRYKFLFLTTVILSASILAYLTLAIRLFDRDKTAYIYDNNAALVETIAEEAATGFYNTIRTLRLMHLAYQQGESGDGRDETVKALFHDDDQMAEASILALVNGKLERQLSLVNENYLAPYHMSQSDFESQLEQLRSLPLEFIRAKGIYFQAITLGGEVPLLTIALPVVQESNGSLQKILVASVRQDRRMAIFQRSSVYTTYLVDALGHILAHSDAKKVLAGESLSDSDVIQTVLSSPAAKGAQEVVGKDGVKRIMAYKKLGLGELIAVSEIPVEKAFYASRRLMEQTAQFALLILCVGFLFTILFTKRLTAALQKLYEATLRIAQGDLDVHVDVKTKDEVGALSRSFTHMAAEIKRLLNETRDKARMEKELETAQLVQDNFFPKNHMQVGDLEIAAYFKPASECGGDWWGSIELEHELILLMGDATGHGVPAALMTAAAHSCTSTLARLGQTVKHIKLTPAFIMDHLNAAIYQAGQGRIKMTFFVAVIDLDTGDVRYVNASHDMPLICRDKTGGHREEPATREDLDALDGAPGPCLGQTLDARFTEHVTTLGPGEAALCYTDGLIECRNAEGEEFGEGRLLRAFTKVAGESAASIRDTLIEKASDFCKARSLDDDMTLIVVRRCPSAQTTQLAG